MKRVLFDTNIILDVLLNRAPWAAEASALWQANDAGRLQGYLTATTLTKFVLHCAARCRAGKSAHGSAAVFTSLRTLPR